MSATIVIPSYNGAHKIPGLLDRLLKQSYPDFEVVLVIDGSTDDSEKVVKEYQTLFNKLTWIKQSNSGRSKTRNKGAGLALGDLLIFYDDDTIPGFDSVKNHVLFHENHEASILGGNPVEKFYPNQSEMQHYKTYLSKKWMRKFDEGLNLLNHQNLFLSAANFSIKKSTFKLLGGFNEHLTDAEDYDLGLRALENNIPVWFDKTNVVIHQEDITCLSYVKRTREYQQAYSFLSNVHSSFNASPKTSSFFKSLVYRLFAFQALVQLIDGEAFLFLPKKIRYKLYDIVIQSLGVEYPEVGLK